MGLSHSTKNKFKTNVYNFTGRTKKCFINIKNSIKNKINNCYISCCLPILYNNKTKSESGVVVNTDIELKEIKSEKPNIKLINCKLDKKTPSLNNYINRDYIRNKSDSNNSSESKENNITLDLQEAI